MVCQFMAVNSSNPMATALDFKFFMESHLWKKSLNNTLVHVGKHDMKVFRNTYICDDFKPYHKSKHLLLKLLQYHRKASNALSYLMIKRAYPLVLVNLSLQKNSQKAHEGIPKIQGSANTRPLQGYAL